MTAMETDDLAVVTGYPTDTALVYGEVVRIIGRNRYEAYVFGCESHQYGYVPVTVLTPLVDIQEENGAWDDFRWDTEDEEYVRLNGVHDYIYSEDDE